ncbi:MAG: hypothetical protein AAFR96_08355 [Planctomycetota bacterium]
MFDLDGGLGDLGEFRPVRLVLYAAFGVAAVWLLWIGVTADWWFVRVTRVVAAVLGLIALGAFVYLQERSTAKQSCLGAGAAFFGSLGIGFAAVVVLIVGEVIDDGRA